MPEILRDSIKNDEEIITSPHAQPIEKLEASIDAAISRRLISKGVEVLTDGPLDEET